MDRKEAIVAAATVAGSLLAASTAYALTSGIVAGGPDDGAGNLSPVVEAPAADHTTASTTAPVALDGTGTRPGQVPGVGTDDHGNSDDAFKHEDSRPAAHESEEPSHYEGRDDDD